MTRDLRAHSRRTRLQLVLGFLLLTILGGSGLIYLVYGREAAAMGITCILAALVPVGMIGVVLTLISWFVKRNDHS